MNRRGFLLGSTAAAAALSTGGLASGAGNNSGKAKLRMCSQLGVIPGKELSEKLDKIAQWGCEAVELYRDSVDNVDKYKKAIDASGLKMAAICWGSCNGDLVSEDPAKRPGCFEKVKQALEAAGELGSVGVVYVPAFNGQTKLCNKEIREILLDTLPKLGEIAVANKTTLIMEPLNRREAFFLRQLADAASICRDCNSEGIRMMGDFYHMTFEETSDMGAFISGGKYLQHVHLGSRSRNRILPGQDGGDYTDGFRGLKMIGYDNFCSFECGCRGDKNVEVPKSIQFLKDQWAQA
jgi:sugar phosphate isomerase/epimerase